MHSINRSAGNRIVRAASDEHDIHGLSDGRAGQVCPSEPQHERIEGETTLRTSAATEMSCVVANSVPATPPWTQGETNPNLPALQHPHPNLMMVPFQHQLHAQRNPVINPASLNLQLLSPEARAQPEMIILTPCSSQECRCMSRNPVISMPSPRFGFSPCVFVSPQSCFLLPDVHNSWNLGPQALPMHHPYNPVCLPRKAGGPESQQCSLVPISAVPAIEQIKEETKPEAKQMNEAPGKDKLQANNTQAPSSSKCAAVSDSAQISEKVKVKEHGNDGEEQGGKEDEAGNKMFKEYLNQLCSDEDFVREVDTLLSTDYLDSLFSDKVSLEPPVPDKKEQETLQAKLQKDSTDSSIGDPVPDTGPSQVESTESRDELGSLFSDLDSLDFFTVEEQAEKVSLWEQSHHPYNSSVSDPNAKDLDFLLCSTSDPFGQIPLKEPKQEPSEMMSERKTHQTSADPGSHPVTGAKNRGTSHVKKAARKLCFQPPHAEFDTNSNQNAAVSKTKEEMLRTDSSPEYSKSVSPLPFPTISLLDNTICSSLQSIQDLLNSNLEATDDDPLAALFNADDGGPSLSGDASASPSNSEHSRSARSSSSEEPHSSPFSADLLSDSPLQSDSSPAQRCRALKASPSAQIKEPEEHCARYINLKSFCRKDRTHKRKGDIDFTDSHPDDCHAQVDGGSFGSVPAVQILEAANRKSKVGGAEARFAPEKDGVVHGKQRSKGTAKGLGEPGESRFEKQSQGTAVTRRIEQLPKMRKKDQYQKLTEEIHTLAVEEGIQIQMSPPSAARERRKIRHSEKDRMDTNASSKRKCNVQERAVNLAVSDQPERSKRGEEESSGKAHKDLKVCPPALPSQMSPKVHRLKKSNSADDLEQKAPRAEPRHEKNNHCASSLESFPVIACENNPKPSPALDQQRRKAENETREGAAEDAEKNSKAQSGNSKSTATLMPPGSSSPTYQKRPGEIKAVRVEEEEQLEASYANRCKVTERGSKDHGNIKGEEDGARIKTTPLPTAGDAKKIQPSEEERVGIEASSERESNVQERAGSRSASNQPERGKRGEEESSGEAAGANTDPTACKVSPPVLPSQMSPRVHRLKKSKSADDLEQKAPREEPLDERNNQGASSLESFSVIACENDPAVRPALRPESIQLERQQSKAAAQRDDAADEESDGKKDLDFYNLRSQGDNAKSKALSVTPGPAQKAHLKGKSLNREPAETQGLDLRRTKRNQPEHRSSEEMEKMANETEKKEKEALKRAVKRRRQKAK